MRQTNSIYSQVLCNAYLFEDGDVVAVLWKSKFFALGHNFSLEAVTEQTQQARDDNCGFVGKSHANHTY